MTKKFIGKKICFSIFFGIGFSCFFVNKVLAELEVKVYPPIIGQTVTESSKLPDYMIYLFNAGMFVGFLAVFISMAWAGAMFALSPVSVEARASAKDRFSGAISGFLILLLTYLIVTTINPQLSIFKLNNLPPVPTPSAEQKKPPGVYFYKSDCSDKSVSPTTTSTPDLGDQLRNQVHFVDIAQDANSQTYYISILYENIDFWGKCRYVDPNKGCQSVDPFASSASVYRYDFNPNGDGIYFYRKACFNRIDQPFNNINNLVDYCNKQSDGYYKIPNPSTIYVAKLEDLKFSGVPQGEQDCLKYDKNGVCVARTPPSLAGENISSLIINGNYLVVFVYFKQGTDTEMSWSSCQEFPSADDANKLGPQQMKWENIRNSNGVVPNYVVVIPIQR